MKVKQTKALIQKLKEQRSLTEAEYAFLIRNRGGETAEAAAAEAVECRRQIYGNAVYLRGLIEISSYCKNDCLYCGIRRGNRSCERYHLKKEEILQRCDAGYGLGFRTFVLQGGEDSYYTDDLLCEIITDIKHRYPDCAVTLSLGERDRESYRRLREAGADRYLLRHETADSTHYARLHPKEMSFARRMNCLEILKELGFQVGCGFMVGAPYQMPELLAKDLKFIEEFCPDMCGIGPFVPHHATPFRDHLPGSVELTLFLLSVLRLIHPRLLLPATTALGTLDPLGREKGILAGANVLMPNLSPAEDCRKYELYDNKLYTGMESAGNAEALKKRIQTIGYEVVISRGDVFSYIESESESVVTGKEVSL